QSRRQELQRTWVQSARMLAVPYRAFRSFMAGAAHVPLLPGGEAPAREGGRLAFLAPRGAEGRAPVLLDAYRDLATDAEGAKEEARAGALRRLEERLHHSHAGAHVALSFSLPAAAEEAAPEDDLLAGADLVRQAGGKPTLTRPFPVQRCLARLKGPG